MVFLPYASNSSATTSFWQIKSDSRVSAKRCGLNKSVGKLVDKSRTQTHNRKLQFGRHDPFELLRLGIDDLRLLALDRLLLARTALRPR